MPNQEAHSKILDSQTTSISDYNAGTYVCITITDLSDVTYVNYEYVTLTN